MQGAFYDLGYVIMNDDSYTEVEGRYHKYDIPICQFFVDSLDRLIIHIAYESDHTDITLSKEKFSELRQFCRNWVEHNT